MPLNKAVSRKLNMDAQKYSWLSVLLVDDSIAILKFVSKVLEDNFSISNVHSASSAPEAM